MFVQQCSMAQNSNDDFGSCYIKTHLAATVRTPAPYRNLGFHVLYTKQVQYSS